MTGNKKQVIEWLLDQEETMFDIDIHKDKRSRDANAYYWVLCGKLSQKANLSAENLYKRHIKDMSVYECLLMKREAVESFRQKWTSGHLGRFITTRASIDNPSCDIVLAYYGSSDFNKAQMNRLIDNLIEDCKTWGVETETPEEIARLVEAWGVKNEH